MSAAVRQEEALLRAEMRRATGRDYRVNLDPLDDASLRELRRFLRDVEYERTAAVRRARMNVFTHGRIP